MFDLIELLIHVHIAIECEPLPVIANGAITYAPESAQNYSLGTIATYSCNVGFSLDLSGGSETRICVDDGDNDAEGVFNGQAPTCACKCLPIILVMSLLQFLYEAVTARV